MTTQESKGTLLIVDDTPANLRVLAQLLTEHGYTPRLMPNGLRALASTRKALPDLILLDIMMPEMDGYEVCAELKADERTRDIPVIFISALDEVFDKVKAFSVGGVDYITKPFQAEEVLARVETHLTLQHLQQTLQQHNQTLEEKINARTTALAKANQNLTLEIEQRKSHQQEKDHLFELAQQQSEQLRSMTNLLIESQQNQRQGLSTGLDIEIQQKITLIRANLKTLQTSLAGQADPHIATHLANITQLLTEMEGYVSQVSSELDQSEVLEENISNNPLLQLSSREQQVLQLIVQGKTNAEVADILTITVNTVHTYLKRIRRKLDIYDMPSLIKFAQKHGLIG